MGELPTLTNLLFALHGTMAELTLNRQWVKEVDQRAVHEYGMSSLVLMENAGRGAAERLGQLGISGKVVICCGKGNNGGDGLVMARWLDLQNIPVQIILWGEPANLSKDAAAQLQIIHHSGIPCELWGGDFLDDHWQALTHQATWLVDGLLGTGTQGPPRFPLDKAIREMNAHPAPIFALDLPSGLDADTGQPAPTTILAQHTCTFVACKPGLSQSAAQPFLGTVSVHPIGVPRRLLQSIAQEALLQET